MIGSAQRAETGIPQNEVAPAPKKQEAPKELSEEQIKTREKLAKFATEQKAKRSAETKILVAKDQARVAKEIPLIQSRAKELAKPSGYAREMPAITQAQIDAYKKINTDRVVDSAPRIYDSKDNAGEMPAITQAQIDAWNRLKANKRPKTTERQPITNIDSSKRDTNRVSDYVAPTASDMPPMKVVSPLEVTVGDQNWTDKIQNLPADKPEPKKQGFLEKFFGKKAA